MQQTYTTIPHHHLQHSQRTAWQFRLSKAQTVGSTMFASLLLLQYCLYDVDVDTMWWCSWLFFDAVPLAFVVLTLYWLLLSVFMLLSLFHLEWYCSPCWDFPKRGHTVQIDIVLGMMTLCLVGMLGKFWFITADWDDVGGCRGHGQTALTLLFPTG